MELISKLIEVVQGAVLHPTFEGAIDIFILSLIGEFLGFIPTSLILSAALVFLKGGFTIELAIRLFFFVAIPYALGNVIGSIPVYAICYWGGKPAIEKLHKYIRFSWNDVERVKARFKGTWVDEIVLLGLRVAPPVPTPPVNIAAGILRIRVAPYLTMTMVGMTVRLMIMFSLVGLGIINLQ